MDIYEYLSSKSIIISDERFKGNVEVSISEQIQLISDAHKRLLAGKEAIIPRIQSVIGKDFEAYKVDIKKNKNYISKITNNKGTSYIEDYLIDEGTSIIKNAEETFADVPPAILIPSLLNQTVTCNPSIKKPFPVSPYSLTKKRSISFGVLPC